MTARYSAATERALARVEKGESLYSASKAEGIAYNTLWKAVQRHNGVPPNKSTVQKNRDEIRTLRQVGASFRDAFKIADQFARSNEEYLTLHGAEADRLLSMDTTILEEPAPKRRGRPIRKAGSEDGGGEVQQEQASEEQGTTT